MKLSRENKSEAELVDAFAQLFRREMNFNAQLFQNVRTAAAGRYAAAAMLYDHYVGRRENEHDGGRDVKKIETVATSPANIKQRTGQLSSVDHWIDRAFHQKPDESNQFVSGFTFTMQSDEKIAFERVIDLLGKKKRHGITDVADIEVASRCEFFGQGFHR